jgi:thioredoxin 1
MKLSDFQEKIENNETPLVVDFWAPWCVPCRTTKPILENLAAEYSGRVEFLAINADEAHEITGHYRVMAIPTVMSFHEGELIGRVTGAQNEQNYRKIFAATLEGDQVRVPLSTFDRALRLGAGLALIGIAMASSSWLLALAGGVVTFTGIYDRCPLFQALTRQLSRR